MNHLHRRRPLGQRIADTAFAVAVFPLLYPLAVVFHRQDRREAGTR